MDKSSLAHTKWNCKYHIVFAPKYRRQVIYGKSFLRCAFFVIDGCKMNTQVQVS